MNQKKSWVFITDWYPRETDPWNGIFIAKWLDFLKDDFDFTVIVWRSKQSRNQLCIQDTSFGKEIIIETRSGLSGAWWHWMKFRKQVIRELPNNFQLLLAPLPWSWVLKNFFLGSKNYQLSEHQSTYFPLYFQNLSFWKKLLYRKGLEGATHIFTVSLALKSAILTGLPSAQVSVIPNRVERIPMIGRKKKNRIAIIGDIRDQVKGISQGLEWIQQAFSSFEIAVVGNGPDLTRIKETFPKVSFLPAMPHDELLLFIEETSVVVINSPFETFSLLAYEVQQLGTYLLCRKNGGPEDYSSEHVVWFSNSSEFSVGAQKIKENISRNQFPPPFHHQSLEDSKILQLWKEALQ